MGLQDERREETRGRLVEATVACLVERGYANLTTAEVAQRAGVSKGAQLYHFPKKDDLVVAALEHLFSERIEASKKIITTLPKDIRLRIGAVVDELWAVYKGNTFYAWLELAVASRTDIALREAVLRASRKFFDETVAMWQAGFPEVRADPVSFVVLSQMINGQLAALRLLPDSEDSPKLSASLSALKDVGNFLLVRMRAKRR